MISFGGVAKPETDATPHRKTEVGRKLPEPKPERNWESISNEQLKNMKSGRGGGAVEEKIYRAFRAIADYKRKISILN